MEYGFVVVLWLACLCGRGVDAHLNLFMNDTETRRILGIPGDLFYVRNGIINEYALSFNIPIKSDVTDIYFVWQSLHKIPHEPAMYYSMSVAVSNQAVMSQPHPSIPTEGTVPSKPSVFSISLPCTGHMTAEVDIKIQLNITIFSASNITVLEFKRKKICLKNDFLTNNDDILGYSSNVNSSSHARSQDADTELLSSGTMFYIVVGSACGVIFVITIVLVVCFLRCRTAVVDHIYDSSVAQPLTHEKSYNRSDTPSNRSVVSGSATVCRTTVGGNSSTYGEVHPADTRCLLSEIQISRSLVTLTDVLLEGTFGRIYRGTVVVDASGAECLQNVLIKTVTNEARQDQVEVMLKDCCLTKGVSHDHISSVIMACLQPIDQPPLVIYADIGGGTCNLKKFLQHCKMSEVLSAQQLVYLAIQIARGIQHLHRKRLLHRDVATRNCLVNAQLHVQVSDCALARDVFPNDYHCLGDNENRPIKWLALEALVQRKFSTASDMWAFGVTIWELFTLGQQPYSEIDPFEMATFLQDGYRITQPLNCPSDLFSIMACCWCLNPDERPKFVQMQACLQDFYTALGRFV